MSDTVKKTLLTAYDDLSFAEESLCDSLGTVNGEAERLKDQIASTRKAKNEISQHWAKTFGTEISVEVFKQEG